MGHTSRFVWHDLNTHDVEGAKRFYGDLFGWSFDASGNEAYHHVNAGAQMIGGIRRKDAVEPGPPSWLGYVLVDDVPDAVERVTAADGRVYMPPTTMPDVGTFAVVADPTGGVVAPWRSARAEANEEACAPPANHTFCWDELLTTDPALAAKFYSAVFGWDEESQESGAQEMGEAGDYALLTRPGVTDPTRGGKPALAAGVVKAPPALPYSFWLPYVRVECVDAAAERAAQLGASVTVPPTDVPNLGRFCSFADPQKTAIGCLSYSDDPAKRP